MTYKGFNIIPISDYETTCCIDFYLVMSRQGYMMFHSRDLDVCKIWIDNFNRMNYERAFDNIKDLVKEGM